MIGSIVAAVALAAQPQAAARRFEVAERLKDLDRAWIATTDRSRRSAAIPKIASAADLLRGQVHTAASMALDEATAVLLNRPVLPEDALSLRFDPPVVEPRTAAKLRISWAYKPIVERSVRVQVGRQSVVAVPGRDLVLEVRPEQLNPEILQNPEVGYLVPVQVGMEQRSVYLSIVKKPTDRLSDLRKSKQPEAQVLVQHIQSILDNPEIYESDVPIIQYLFTAELFDEGRLRPDRVDVLPFAVHKQTAFRAAFPRQVRGPLTLVIAMHGDGGSESSFFEGYGHGLAVAEAARRNWAFVAPRASATAISDVLDWIQARRKQPVARIFVLGYNDGASLAFRSPISKPKPSAIAAFAPDWREVPSSLEGIPVFLSVGKQDSLAGNLKQLSNALSARGNSKFEEIDPCERLMVVSESIPGAFRFFDTYAGR